MPVSDPQAMVSPGSSAAPPLQPAVGALRVVDGARLDQPAPGTVAMATPRGAAADRRREHLFLLIHLIGPASPTLLNVVCDVASRAYWATSGSITAALRVAAAAANRHLLNDNLRADPGQRSYGSMICAVLSGEDVFLLKAGSAWAAIWHPTWQESLLYGEEVPALGVSGAAPVRPSHASVRAGDTMALTVPALTVDERSEAVTSVLGSATVEEAVDGVDGARTSEDFAALVIRFGDWQRRPAVPEHSRVDRIQVRDVPAEPDDMAHVPLVGPAAPPAPVGSPRGQPVYTPSVGVAERLGQALGSVGRWMGRSAHAAGGAVVRAAPSMGRAIKTLARQLLPGSEPGTPKRKRPPRPVPPENRRAMIIIASAIPLMLAAILGLAWQQFGHDARFEALMDQAEQAAILAQLAGGTTPQARVHWREVLGITKEAGSIHPGDRRVNELRALALESLDASFGVVRLAPVLVHDLGPSEAPRRLLVQGQMVLALDPALGWVAELALGADNRLASSGDPPMLVTTGHEISHETVGDLIDLMWADLAGGRQTSGVVILEAGGWTIYYDPTWTASDGRARLVRTRLGVSPAGQPSRIGSYEGRLYILDPIEGQIWRYNPSGDTYPTAPESYFGGSLPVPLDRVVDMAIDGNIYLLYDDGTIRKFHGGAEQAFEVRGLPDEAGLAGAVAIAADPSGIWRDLFVADPAHQRVVRLSPDGEFVRQYRADGAFEALEALAIDESGRRLFTISAGQLFVAPLP